MSWMLVLNIAGPIVLAVLIFAFIRLRNRDKFEAIMKKRKGAKLIDRADFVEGPTHFPVVLSLTDRELFYENMELAAHLDLERIEEVEYADELATGAHSHGKVLRLRSHGHTFEFVLDPKSAPKWSEHLPVHHFDDPGQVHSV
jgi:hypothetical protein